MALIFDLDQTLIDSSLAEPHRVARNWSLAYGTIPQFTLYEGIQLVFDFIRQNKIPYVIVTSSPSAYCTKVCQHWGFLPNHIIGYHDTSRRKPHPDPIQLAINKMNVDSKTVLSFGDRDIDIQASNAAGAVSVACLWGASDKKSLLAAKPAYIAHTPDEMLEIIKGSLKK